MAALRIEPWKTAGSGELDLAAVVAVFRQGLARQCPPEVRTAASARALLEEWLGAPRTAGLVARGKGGAVEGVLFFRSEPPAVRILHVAARELRGGTGSQLLEALRGICAARGVWEVRAAVPPGATEASKFFRRCGFSTTNLSNGDIAAPQAGPVAVELSLQITAA